MITDREFLETCHKEVESLFSKYPEYIALDSFNLKTYIGTQHHLKGLKIPDARKIFTHGYSFSTLQLHEQLYIWDYIWHQSDVFEIKSQALFFLDKYYSKVDALLLWNTIKQWTSTIDNWAHSDCLSKIYSHMLEILGMNVYIQLEKWNTSSNPWERRQSIVSLLYYRRNRKVFLAFEAYISLIDALLTDKNYYVQKGIGWTLRELLQQYESETFEYIMAHAHLITSTAYYATAEKMTDTQKEQFKLLRKKN